MSFIIHCEPNYYAGTFGVSKPGALRDRDERYITLSTEAEAELLCGMLNDPGEGAYMLSYGQYAPPEYTTEESELPVRFTLREAMFELELHYDFKEDGTRIEIDEFGEPT